jgi:hypothetical protein
VQGEQTQQARAHRLREQPASAFQILNPWPGPGSPTYYGLSPTPTNIAVPPRYRAGAQASRRCLLRSRRPRSCKPTRWRARRWPRMVRALPGRSSALRVLHSTSGLYCAFVWARRALTSPKRRFPARAAAEKAKTASAEMTTLQADASEALRRQLLAMVRGPAGICPLCKHLH